MIHVTRLSILGALCILVTSTVAGQNGTSPPTSAQSIKGHFTSVNQRVLAMAQDFPADKYSFRPRPEMRTFGEVIVHIASGNIYAGKAGRGGAVNWDELSPKDYSSKAAIVSLMERSITEADATLKGLPAESFNRTLEPWIGVMEHSAEHYGLLVAYYRLNGLVPPESRPRK